MDTTELLAQPAWEMTSLTLSIRRGRVTRSATILLGSSVRISRRIGGWGGVEYGPRTALWVKVGEAEDNTDLSPMWLCDSSQLLSPSVGSGHTPLLWACHRHAHLNVPTPLQGATPRYLHFIGEKTCSESVSNLSLGSRSDCLLGPHS